MIAYHRTPEECKASYLRELEGIDLAIGGIYDELGYTQRSGERVELHMKRLRLQARREQVEAFLRRLEEEQSQA